MKRDKRLDKQYLELLKQAKKLNVGDKEFIDKEINKYEKKLRGRRKY